MKLGRLVIAAVAAAAVANFLTLVVMLVYTGWSGGANAGATLLLATAVTLTLRWLLFWVLVALIGLPLSHVALSQRRFESRRAYMLAAAGIPVAFMAVITIVSHQVRWGDFIFVAILCGIPTGLVFRSLAREVSGGRLTSRYVVSGGAATASLLILVAATWSTWHFTNGVASLRAEISYRAHHFKWPVLCMSFDNESMEPTWVRRGTESTICRTYADQGDAITETAVANGNFGSVSPVERAAWLQKAAAQDYEPALSQLASMLGPFSSDQGVPKDTDRAIVLYQRAAELGDTVSRAILAVAYKRGQGVPQDMVVSLMWRELVLLAAKREGGLPEQGMQKSFDDFAAALTPEQVAEAHKRALEFLATHDQ